MFLNLVYNYLCTRTYRNNLEGVMYGIKLSFVKSICIVTFTLFLMTVLSAQVKLDGKLSVGDSSPTFFLRDINGDDFFLSDHVGEPRNRSSIQERKKVVILSFFATWCVPCKEELPELQSITTSYSNESLLTVLIDVNEKSGKVATFLKSLEVELPVLLDKYGKISEGFNVVSLPTLIIIDSEGIIRFISKSFKGADEFRNILNAEIRKVLDS